MELMIVLGLLGGLALFFIGGSLWFWMGLLGVACIIEYRAYRVICRVCGERVMSGLKMKFCNQCGTEQSVKRGVRLRCESCHRLTRSELNMSHCNHCGSAT